MGLVVEGEMMKGSYLQSEKKGGLLDNLGIKKGVLLRLELLLT